MYKKIVLLGLISLLVGSLQPRASHAVVGEGFGLPAVATVGALLPLTALVGVSVYADQSGGNCGDAGVDCYIAMGGLTLVGLVLLDDNQAQTFVFGPLSDQQAHALGIDAANYNQELPEINAVQDTVREDLRNTVKYRPTMSVSEITELFQSRWGAYQTALSPQAYSVVQAILKEPVGSGDR